mgnify:CR=1 FL=1
MKVVTIKNICQYDKKEHKLNQGDNNLLILFFNKLIINFKGMTEYILSNEEMAQADQITITSGISSIQLMENAGKAVFKNLPTKNINRVLILAGPGNNGGDGFVVARLLIEIGTQVDVYFFSSKKISKDCEINKNRIDDHIIIDEITDFSQYAYVVDALFGTGFTRRIPKVLENLFFKIKKNKIPVYAVDIPSGINGNSSKIDGDCLQCSKTITFFNKKKCHYLYPGKRFCGEVIVEDIGISKEIFKTVNPKIKNNNPDLWIKEFPFPSSADHKYSRGLLVINSGPIYKTGAARLAGRSAMRVGAGAVKLICDEEAAKVLEPQISVELISVVKEKNEIQKIFKDKKVSSVLVGPGNGINDETKTRTLMALAFVDHVVIDADAITCFEDNPKELFIDTYSHTILTPHEGEFRRLFGEKIASIEDKVVRTVEASKIAGSIIVLKGSDTVIADPEGNVVINSSEAPYLATAGSGDVLAGIIASLAGKKKMNAFNAACAGTWIHSKLGELIGPGLIAEDLIDNIPLVIKKLYNNDY